MNGTHVQSPDFPQDYRTAQTCTYNLVKIEKEICFFRLDFVTFNIDGPSLTADAQTSQDCNTNSMTFTTPSSIPPPTICGYNDGQHLYLDASAGLDSNPAMVITTSGTTVNRIWQIRVDQIHCGQLHSPPHGCLQYFMEPSGTVSSFNYGYDNSFQQLNGQLYSVCFRRAKTYCSISYKASSKGNSFSVSTTPNNQKSRAGEFSCVSDFLIIPRGTNGGAGVNCYTAAANTGGMPTTTQFQSHLGRYCHHRLNCYSGASSNSIIYSDLLPFKIYVELNGAEPTSANGNRGFSLDFQQILC
jgi:hypothetical protein